MDWGLRKYPDEANIIWDGDKNCEHNWIDFNRKGISGEFCSKCNAWYGQLGLEPTLELYIKHLLQITKELKRVLKPTGIMFWNQGDSYIGSLQGYGVKDKRLPAKCMAMQNFRLVLKMIEEQGWILRNIIIWYKPNHLPESVKDRFTRSYEPIFMLTKSKKYYFNLNEVREPLKSFTENRKQDMKRLNSFNIRVREAKKGHFGKLGVRASEEEMKKYDNKGRLIKWSSPNSEIVRFMREKGSGGQFDYGGINSPDSAFKNKYYSGEYSGKNPGDMWNIPTQPFPEAHFATFPEELVRRCIKAGCPPGGTVLDPFVGSGTVLKVAIEERVNAIGIEIVEDYCKMAIKRCNLINNPFIKFEYINLKDSK